MKTIALSAGHSLSDPGAVYDAGTKENFLTIKIVEFAADILRKHGVGVITIPDNLGLVETINYINDRANQLDLAVEVHINADARQAKGVEAWFFHNFNTGQPDAQSQKLAQCLVNALNAETQMVNRGIFDESTNKWGKLGFVHDTTPLAALVECGFIDNADDLKLLATDDGRYTIAKGVARGILDNLAIKWQPELLYPEQPKPDITAELRKTIIEKSNEIESLKLKNKALNDKVEQLTDDLNRYKSAVEANKKLFQNL